MAERKTISKKLRFEVFKRDSFTCQYCGKNAPDVVLEIDHIEPVSKGGKNTITNLITSCFDCNRGKSNRKLTENQTLKAQKKELDKLNQRKEQLEMMAKWQMELIDIEKQEAEKIVEIVNKKLNLCFGWTNKGLEIIISYIKKYGFNEVLESSIIAYGQYKNGEVAFNKINGICYNRKLEKENPVLKDLYYIKGIMKNRFPNVVDWKAMQLMQQGLEADISISELKEIAKGSNSWTQWQETIKQYIRGEI